MALEQIQTPRTEWCGKIHEDALNSKQSVERRGIGLQALINGLNCFEEYIATISFNAKHLGPRVKWNIVSAQGMKRSKEQMIKCTQSDNPVLNCEEGGAIAKGIENSKTDQEKVQKF